MKLKRAFLALQSRFPGRSVSIDKQLALTQYDESNSGTHCTWSVCVHCSLAERRLLPHGPYCEAFQGATIEEALAKAGAFNPADYFRSSDASGVNLGAVLSEITEDDCIAPTPFDPPGAA